MNKEIIINNIKISYTLKRSRKIKLLRLAIYPDASIVVTTPIFTSIYTIEKFLKKKINWIIRKLEDSKNNINLIINQGREDYLKNKEKARLLVLNKINHLNKIYNFKYKRVNIKNQKTLWGSCSSAGNLNFNYKIIYLPNELASYIVVHELCHLKEMNHSQRFWNLIAISIPNYKNIRKELKRYNLK